MTDDSASALHRALNKTTPIWGGWITGPTLIGPEEFARAGYDYATQNFKPFAWPLPMTENKYAVLSGNGALAGQALLRLKCDNKWSAILFPSRLVRSLFSPRSITSHKRN